MKYCFTEAKKMTEKIEIVWNQAVSEVGGHSNTFNNFKVIMKRFYELAREKGISYEKAKAQPMGNLIATSEFMEVVERRKK